jgi:hypothetical protein
MKLSISTPAFKDGLDVPRAYTCDGQDINPEIIIEGVPQKAKSLALIVDDPDAPNGDWVHWLLFNIDPSVARIPENSVPEGALEGTNTFGDAKYEGPCPPLGPVHHYYFKVYALDTMLTLSAGVEKEELLKAMGDHILAQGEVMGIYGRSS